MKISKICTFMDFFWTKDKMLDLKKYRGVMFSSTEYWCNIWCKTDLCFQKWHEKFSKFSVEHFRKSKNWNFDKVLLFKVENIWPKNLLGSFVSWQWRMKQNLKRNWLVSWKLAWAIWQILTQRLNSLKKLHCNGLPLTKVHNVWRKKVQGR